VFGRLGKYDLHKYDPKQLSLLSDVAFLSVLSDVSGTTGAEKEAAADCGDAGPKSCAEIKGR